MSILIYPVVGAEMVQHQQKLTILYSQEDMASERNWRTRRLTQGRSVSMLLGGNILAPMDLGEERVPGPDIPSYSRTW